MGIEGVVRKIVLFIAVSAALLLTALSLGCGNTPGARTPPFAKASATTSSRDHARHKAVGGPGERREEASQAFDKALAIRLSDTAKTLAGMPVTPESQFAAIQQTPAWFTHAGFMKAGWEGLEKDHLARIRLWSRAQLSAVGRSTVFYPFSGPDFLFAHAFFPDGKDYILIGLEPIGEIPDLRSLSGQGLEKELKWVDESLCGLLQISFFRTNDMKVGMAEEGVLPILMVFLARTDNAVLAVDYIGLNGQPMSLASAGGTSAGQARPKGVLVTFLPKGETSPRRLYYFSVDLSDYSLKDKREFTRFLKRFPSPTTYLKAASYLMYREKYSRIRGFIISKSAALLQDDSGIPFKEFDPVRWNIRFYGAYTRPIALFKDRFQPELLAAYSSGGGGPLDFGVGYKHRAGEANLMLALAKQPPGPQMPACPQAREFMARGLFVQAAQAFQRELLGGDASYSIRIAVSCLPSSIAGAVLASEGRQEFMLVPGRLEGQPCFQALWGLYPTRDDALAALDEVPGTFSMKDSPSVIRLEGRGPAA